MFVVVPLGLLMMVTGIYMKAGVYTPAVMSLHGSASILFSIFLFVMMVSGIVLYLFPILQKRKAQKSVQ